MQNRKKGYSVPVLGFALAGVAVLCIQVEIPMGSFWDVKAINLFTLGGLVVAYLQYRRGRKRDDEERARNRREMEDRQEQRHVENQRRFDALIQFQRDQTDINRKRDFQLDELRKQTGELEKQTAIITQMFKATEWRLTRLEDGGHGDPYRPR